MTEISKYKSKACDLLKYRIFFSSFSIFLALSVCGGYFHSCALASFLCQTLAAFLFSYLTVPLACIYYQVSICILYFSAELYPSSLTSVTQGIHHIWNFDKLLVEKGIVSDENTSFLALERTVLDIAAYPGVTQGVYLASVFSADGNHLIRFFESGSFIGFHHKEGCKVKSIRHSCCFVIFTCGHYFHWKNVFLPVSLTHTHSLMNFPFLWSRVIQVPRIK